MKTSLVLTTYNRPDTLELLLISLLKQKVMVNEILIADDGSGYETKTVIDYFKNIFKIPIVHIWHEDKGFRKTVILNKALFNARGEYIIQIDGDVILHPCFIKDHLSFAKKGTFVKGKRVFMSKLETEKIIHNKNISPSIFAKDTKMREKGIYIPLLKYFFDKGEKSAKGLEGCNFAFWKEDFINVNGYNMNLEGWGLEDFELGTRFINYGLLQRKIAFSAIQYHLYHKITTQVPEIHKEIMENILKERHFYCENGLEQIDNDYNII